MVNYREILRLNSLKYTQRQIAASVHSSRNTVSDVIKLASEAGIDWPLNDSYTNEMLYASLYPNRLEAVNPRKEPDYSYIHKELAKPGVNLTLLWSEYCSECNNNAQTPYMYSQFCDKYRYWARLTKATMRINHKPGDVMQVDWAGTTIKYHDSVTGQEYDAYVFAAVLPCSCYAYVEACDDMKITNWLLCHVHAYSYFGGVPRLLIPDNLKAGVVKNTRYDTVLNRSYEELAGYYDTAIIPARVRHPKDKSLAEGTVKLATTWIIAALRNRLFFSIEEVKSAVAEKLEELNHSQFKKREGCRFTAYSDEEQAFMKPLPLTPFEPAVWSTAMVPLDYLISDGKNKYSVPFDLMGEQVDIRITKATVEVYYHGARVASHPRPAVILRDPVVQPQHMPTEHRKYLSYNSDDFTSWAKDIGSHTAKVVTYFLSAGREPEQGYKSCASLIRLNDKYGHNRLENACKKVLEYTSQPSIRIISTMLKNGQDKVNTDVPSAESKPVNHGITRGEAYFRKGGARS
ncbi:IS21 family transposase [Lacrimispora sp.]|uniref:IS21 family transposase n=1 Tax=Lacrimispora sp. TaxID=2719234 RepID=UPI0034616A7A